MFWWNALQLRTMISKKCNPLWRLSSIISRLERLQLGFNVMRVVFVFHGYNVARRTDIWVYTRRWRVIVPVWIWQVISHRPLSLHLSMANRKPLWCLNQLLLSLTLYPSNANSLIMNIHYRINETGIRDHQANCLYLSVCLVRAIKKSYISSVNDCRNFVFFVTNSKHIWHPVISNCMLINSLAFGWLAYSKSFIC